MVADPEMLEPAGGSSPEAPHLIVSEEAPEDVREALRLCVDGVSRNIQAGRAQGETWKLAEQTLIDPAYVAYFAFDRLTERAITSDDRMQTLRSMRTAESAKAAQIASRRRSRRAEIFIEEAFRAGHIGDIVLSEPE